eukprot:scaffold2.g7086.t1
MASRGPDFEVHVMGKRDGGQGHPKNGGSEDREGQLGACPFSMRVLMLLEEKEVPYRVNFIDVTNKPKWLSEVNPRGTVPVAKDLSSGEWFTDSGVISGTRMHFLEDKYADTREEEAVVGGAGRLTEAAEVDTALVYKKKLGHLVDCPQPAPELWPKLWAYLKARRRLWLSRASEDLEAKAKEELCGQLKARAPPPVAGGLAARRGAGEAWPSDGGGLPSE